MFILIFIFSCKRSLYSKVPKYLKPTIWYIHAFTIHYFPLFITRAPHFFSSNSMLVSWLNTRTVITSAYIWSLFFSYSFKSSMYNRSYWILTLFPDAILSLALRRVIESCVREIKKNVSGKVVPLEILTSPRSFPFDIKTVFKFFMLSFTNHGTLGVMPNFQNPRLRHHIIVQFYSLGADHSLVRHWSFLCCSWTRWECLRDFIMQLKICKNKI